MADQETDGIQLARGRGGGRSSWRKKYEFEEVERGREEE